VVTFCYVTGWRISEVLRLEWRNIDFAAGIVRLEPQTTKNDDGRTFPFAVLPELEAVLRSQRAATSALERDQGRIIARVFHRHGVPIQGLRKAWATACLAAGLFQVISATRGDTVRARKVPTMVPHDFRRTAVRNLERAGVSRSVAMKLTGHRTESVFRRYAIVNEADLAEGLTKLAALHASEPTTPTTPTTPKVVPMRKGRRG
jgi:integrase